MSRRLQQLSEENLEAGGKRAQRSLHEADFSEDLKAKLLERIAHSDFKEKHAAAISIADAPEYVDKASRATAASPAWQGSEKLEAAASRMLHDAYKPMKVPFQVPRPAPPPRRVDTGRPGKAPSSGVRLANARDKTSAYAISKDPNATDVEKEEFRRTMKARFGSEGRHAPASLTGLASLADERIADAIARGQFRNLPDRGKPMERDYNADSPFIDTTAYFMNKIIKKQEIVPPWIEKQQELTTTVTRFRGRLRKDWKRHAARVIASAGGRLEDQMRRADEYARAEAIANPQTPAGSSEQDAAPAPSPSAHAPDPAAEAYVPAAATTPPPTPPPSRTIVFRDAAWEQTEHSYLSTAIAELNALTRTYNLMAPNMARKPYFSLERELRACFADVAPQLAGELRDRALAPRAHALATPGRAAPTLIDSIARDAVRVYDERRPHYGFREFWRDLRANLSTKD